MQALAGDEIRDSDVRDDVPVDIRDRYRRSRLSALKYGCEMHGILPSKGPESCVFAPRCGYAQDVELRHRCVAGEECPLVFDSLEVDHLGAIR